MHLTIFELLLVAVPRSIHIVQADSLLHLETHSRLQQRPAAVHIAQILHKLTNSDLIIG